MNFNNLIFKLKEKLIYLFGKNKKLFVLVLVLIISVGLTFIFFPSNASEKKNESKQEIISVNKLDYSRTIENKIEEMLLNLSEVSKAEVMVVCDSTEIYEYLKNIDETKNENNTTTRHEEVVYQKDGSNTLPIIITSKMPKIVGVWIIINSVSASTKLAITNSIESVLNIDKECISILQER